MLTDTKHQNTTNMDESYRRALSQALPEVVSKLKVTTKLKALLVAAGIYTEEEEDYIFTAKKCDGELVFWLVQKLKRKRKDEFEGFLSALRQVGQANIGELLDSRCSTSLESSPDSQSQYSSSYSITAASAKSRLTPVASPITKSQIVPGTAGSRSSTLSIEQMRDLLQQVMPKGGYSSSFGDIVVVYSYFNECARFMRGHTSRIPGAYQDPPDRVAINDELTAAIPPIAAATICKLLGGKIKYMLQKRHGSPVWTSVDGDLKYVLMRIYRHPSDTLLMDAYASVSAILQPAVASVLGYFPPRLYTPVKTAFGPMRDVSLNMKVIDWFKDAPTTQIFIEKD